MTSWSRLDISVRGVVQGVGFRPFVYRLAYELGLRGWVRNGPQGVRIEVEGSRNNLESFLVRLAREGPPRSSLQGLESRWLDPAGYEDFAIRESEAGGEKTVLVPPDIATCHECLREILDPANRRHFYPFTNCSHCGPRFSLIEALPYDRANTSMRQFIMCGACQAEYENPADRRFHAQPNACPACGPRLELWAGSGAPLEHGAGSEQVLRAAAHAILGGSILALKGLGGFQFIVAGHLEAAVRRLRERKHREEKPFALMFPSLAATREVCEVVPLEERLLGSPEAPIVLLRRRRSEFAGAALAPSLAPGNPNLGVMLPYTPLHHLLLTLIGVPVVATSGNLSDEPICIDEAEALAQLGGVADLFLVHNRPIVRQMDDSIVRIMAGRELVLRRARGYAPLPVELPASPQGPSADACVIAVGAHLKNTVALRIGRQAFLSQHLGDLETEAAYAAFRRAVVDLPRLYQAVPETIVADFHPDYLSSKFAREWVAGAGGDGETDAKEAPQAPTATPQRRLVQVQHHLAHVLACMAENDLRPPVLGVSWDGTGYGLDGTIWGGEFFVLTNGGCSRSAHLRPFPLPGGDRAVREPRRSALGLLFAMLGDAVFAEGGLPLTGAFSERELTALRTMLRRGTQCPLSSSVGRLFDAVAALVGLRQVTRFEGQSAMDLEFAAESAATIGHYPVHWRKPEPVGASGAEVESMAVLDWEPMIRSLIADKRMGITPGEMAARFHGYLAEAVVEAAKRSGLERVVLSGGCFQNRYLTEKAILRLREEGFQPYWHQRVPPNDGGIALGQLVAAGGDGDPVQSPR